MTAAVQDAPTITDAGRQCMQFAHCDGVGPIRFSRILLRCRSIEAALAASATELARIDGIGPETAAKIVASRNQFDVEGEVQRARAAGVRIVACLDPDYPPGLKTIADPPPVLYVRGRIEPADAVSLAIVGARHCTRYGLEQAQRFAALAAQAGMTVVSGMARGIDSAAHQGALHAGGRTLAVLGCGLEYLYPPDAGPLAERIAANGALLSELPMSTPPDEKNFPRRNRIIAGLALGALIVEAAARSGALITARLANEYNREVFAVPGRLDSPHADGCNALIQRGEAKLVTSFGDILSELGEVGRTLMPVAPDGKAHESAPRPVVPLDPEQTAILAAFEQEPMSIDHLAEATGFAPARVAALVTMLQLKGVVRGAGPNFYEKV
ncbi:MAG: DNA-processing protein DprA [Phycisphaerae bacterium]|nr:DNA-processing protein DprA [Phycisphaerae bacterium]